MRLHWRLDEQTVLVTAVVVIVNVVCNHRDEVALACKCVPVVAFSFKDTPESLHRAVVNAAANTGHALRHTGIQQFLVEDSTGVLESTVTVEQRMCIWIFLNSLVKGVKDQFVVISATDNVADNSAVAQIKNCTQIEFVDDWTFVPLELRHISQPLFIWLSRPKFTVQNVRHSNLWGRCSFCAAMILEFNGRLNMENSAQMQNALITGQNAVILFQIIPDPTVTLIRVLCVNLLDRRRNFLAFEFVPTFRMVQPFVIG